MKPLLKEVRAMLKMELENNLELYLDSLKTKNYSNETIKNYNTAITKFINYLTLAGDPEINQSGVNSIVESYQKFLSNECNYSSSTVNQYIINLKPFLNNMGLGFTVKKVNTEVNPEIKYLTLEEIEEILFTIDQVEHNSFKKQQYKALVRFIFYTGARIKEVEKLKISDIRKDNTSYYAVINGKGNKTVKQLLPAKAYDMIMELVRSRSLSMNSNEPLFINSNGTVLSVRSIQKYFKKIGSITDERLNAKGKAPEPSIVSRFTPHSLRHSLAIYLLVDKAKPINLVKEMLRHTDIKTTQKYLIFSNTVTRELAKNVFDSII